MNLKPWWAQPMWVLLNVKSDTKEDILSGKPPFIQITGNQTCLSLKINVFNVAKKEYSNRY